MEQHEIDLSDMISLPRQFDDEQDEFREAALKRPVTDARRLAQPRSLAQPRRVTQHGDAAPEYRQLQELLTQQVDPSEPAWHGLSRWSQSSVKRLFDCACVLLAMPLAVPLILAIGVLVRLTSRGPVLFLQERVGRHGKIFQIVKFRTMEHLQDAKHHPITTSDNQRFTSVGPLLRRWKLDELPQILNVLTGHMSLVGPRPKLPEHVIFDLPCRPGITGMATILFASEEAALARIPKDRLKTYYHSFVLPMKQQLDADYMSHATLLTDLNILVNSVLRRWGSTTFDKFAPVSTAGKQDGMTSSKRSGTDGLPTWGAMSNLAETMKVTAFQPAPRD